jgi:hypothetical protein
MSQRKNHRRSGTGQDNGPRYENPCPSAGCNSTHVARSRKKWKRRTARALRRTGNLGTKYRYGSRRSLLGQPDESSIDP